jgi:hypothetical protein
VSQPFPEPPPPSNTTASGSAGSASRRSTPTQRPAKSYGIAGAVLAVLGAAALAVAFTVPDWLDTNGFSRIRRALGHAAWAAGFSKAYFTWLAFALAALAFVLALAANAPTAASGLLRLLGLLAGLAGAGLTFLAIRVNPHVAYSQYLHHVRAGFWVAVGGFLGVGVGAVVGPRSRW